MTEITPLLDEFEAAVADEDLKQAERTLLAINNASQTVPELLNECKTLVGNERYDRAKTIANRLNDKYDAVADREQVLYQKALLAKYIGISDRERKTLEEFYENLTQTQFERSQVLMRLIALLSKPESFDDGELQQNITDLIDSERALRRTANDTETVVSGMSLPARIEIVSISPSQNPIKKGSSVTTRVTIKNIGTAPVKDVRLQVRGEAGVGIDAPPGTVGELDAGASATRKFTLTSKRSGTHTLTFLVSSSNAGSATDQATVVVIEKDEFATVPGHSAGDELAGFDTENLPDWLPVAGGAGVLGLGAGAYGYLSRDSDEQDEEEESEWL